MSIQQTLTAILEKACKINFPNFDSNGKVEISPSIFGDYKSSISYAISSKTGKKSKEISDILCKSIIESDSDLGIFDKVEATGSGFISFSLNNKWLVHQCFHKDSFTIKNKTGSQISKKADVKNICIDHGSPNMSKELHVGHLRSIMIGDCLSKVLKYQGHNVVTVSHVGDYGTPIAMVVAESIISQKPWAQIPQVPNSFPTPSELSKLYVQAKANSKTNFLFTNSCLSEIQKIDRTQAEPHIINVYNMICEASRVGFNKIYKDLNVEIPEKGESWYGHLIPQMLEELKSKQIIKESKGAWVAHLDSYKDPLIVVKSDSSWLYGTTDLACIRYRILEQKFDTILYVVDFTQQDHFSKIFEIAKKAGWYNPEKHQINHVSFGVVQGKNGLKLSSRDGNPISLSELLTEAIEQTRMALITANSIIRSDRQDQNLEPNSIDEKISEPKRMGKLDLKSHAIIELAEENSSKIAFNAIKYFELSQARSLNYIFSFESMLNFRGNTSFYIIYAYARIHTLYKRANEKGLKLPELQDNSSDFLKDDEIESLLNIERQLILNILQFPDIVYSVEKTLCPHLLAAYVFKNTQLFHSFYENCRVLESKNQNLRLLLCKATEKILSQSLELLNVQTVSRI